MYCQYVFNHIHNIFLYVAVRSTTEDLTNRDQPMTIVTFANTPDPTSPESVPESNSQGLERGVVIIIVSIVLLLLCLVITVFTVCAVCGFCLLKSKVHQQENIYTQSNRSYNNRQVLHPQAINETCITRSRLDTRFVDVNGQTDHTYEEIESQLHSDTYDFVIDDHLDNPTTVDGLYHIAQMSTNTLDEDGYMNVY